MTTQRMIESAMLAALFGFAAGAAFMYMLDPDGGRRRRAIARDKIESKLRRFARRAESKGRDLRNRAEGTIAEASRVFEQREPS